MAGLNPDKLRQRRDTYSQAEIAKRGRVKGGAQTISNLEGGRIIDPRLSTLLAVARGLQCSVADLVDEAHPPGK